MFWIELRCESRKQGCYSDKNNGPMTASAEGTQALARNLRMLRDQAREEGWERTSNGHVCPACKDK